MNDQEPDINENPTNWSDYDDFLNEAGKDDRIGPQTFMVSEVVHDTWPSGDPRMKFRGTLTSAGNAKADLTVSPPPSPAVLKAEGASYESGKKRAIATTINLYKQLAQFYAKSPDAIKEGDEYKVQVVRTKRNEDGSGGFLRIVAFLDKNHAVGSSGASASTATAAAKAPF